MKLAGLLVEPVFEAAINRTLKLDANYTALLQPLVGKRLQVKLQDMPLTLMFQPTETKIKVFANGDETADITLAGRIVNLIRLGFSTDPQTLIKEGLVCIDGDMLVLQSFQHMMQKLDFDWEDKLANLIGTNTAYGIAKPVRKTKVWAKQSYQSTQQDITEYLQEEKRIFPSSEAVEDFYDDIAELRSDVDRVEAKLQLLPSIIKK